MKRTEHQTGLTLLEVMVAIALFAVLMAAVSSSLPSMFRLNRSTTSVQSISSHAKNVIDLTRSFWLTPTTSTTPGSDHYPNLTSGTLPDDLPETPPNLTCLDPVTQEVTSMVKPGSTSVPPVTWTTRRRITVSCRDKASSGAYTDFVAEIGRPE